MKKLFISLMMLPMLILGAACSSEEPDPANPAAEVAGTYKGWTEASCAYFQGTLADNQTVILTEAGVVCSVVYESDSWGSFLISNVAVDYSGGVFNLSGSGSCSMGHAGSVKDYPCTVTGSIDPAKESPSFVFKVPAVMGGLTITFTSGKMPAESNDGK